MGSVYRISLQIHGLMHEHKQTKPIVYMNQIMTSLGLTRIISGIND